MGRDANAISAIQTFLLSAFSTNELRRFLTFNYGDLLHEVGGDSPAEFTYSAVMRMNRDDIFDTDEVFDLLVQERVRRQAEIDALRPTKKAGHLEAGTLTEVQAVIAANQLGGQLGDIVADLDGTWTLANPSDQGVAEFLHSLNADDGDKPLTQFLVGVAWLLRHSGATPVVGALRKLGVTPNVRSDDWTKINRRDVFYATFGLLFAAGAGGGAPADQGRGGGPSVDWDEVLDSIDLTFRAIMFSVNDYAGGDTGLSPLVCPKEDTRVLGELFQDRFGFEVEQYPNADRDTILDRLEALEHGPKNEAVVVYYAGHGTLREDHGVGYWQPRGSSRKVRSWVSYKMLEALLKAAAARHVLLIADACYAGSVLSRSSPPTSSATTPELVGRLAESRSRMALTSGGEELVADRGTRGLSVFAYNLHRALSNAAQHQEFVRFTEIYPNLQANVQAQSPQGQLPVMGRLRGADDDEGELVLRVRP